MKFYFAPLEGVTGYIYRNAHNKYFGNLDKYFLPFISPTQNDSFTSKELNDISIEHNKGINVVPQILTNNSIHFVKTMNELKEMGYNEINLNLGCPSGTVVAKGKGSGFLCHKELLDNFMYDIFEKQSTKISIKTRIGKDNPNEFYELIELYNKYPLEEIIIHPRIQTDFYKNTPNMDVFKDALKSSKNPVCYNGDIFSKKDYINLINENPTIDKVMIGRGLIKNPALVSEIKEDASYNKEILKLFHDEVLAGYKEVLSGDKNVLFKMKEFWFYMINSFENNEKSAKKIKKVQKLNEYDAIVKMIFNDLELI